MHGSFRPDGRDRSRQRKVTPVYRSDLVNSGYQYVKASAATHTYWCRSHLLFFLSVRIAYTIIRPESKSHTPRNDRYTCRCIDGCTDDSVRWTRRESKNGWMDHGCVSGDNDVDLPSCTARSFFTLSLTLSGCQPPRAREREGSIDQRRGGVRGE